MLFDNSFATNALYTEILTKIAYLQVQVDKDGCDMRQRQLC